jgi:hypothetical protein
MSDQPDDEVPEELRELRGRIFRTMDVVLSTYAAGALLEDESRAAMEALNTLQRIADAVYARYLQNR